MEIESSYYGPFDFVPACGKMDREKIVAYEFHEENISLGERQRQRTSVSQGTVCTAILAEFASEVEIFGISVSGADGTIKQRGYLLGLHYCCPQLWDFFGLW